MGKVSVDDEVARVDAVVNIASSQLITFKGCRVLTDIDFHARDDQSVCGVVTVGISAGLIKAVTISYAKNDIECISSGLGDLEHVRFSGALRGILVQVGL